MRPRLLVAEPEAMSPTAIATLEEVAEVTLRDCRERGDLLAAVADADVLWVRLRHRIDAEVLANAPALRIVATPTTGWTHLDIDALDARSVEVVSLRGETEFLATIPATAEHTVLLLLALLRRLVPAAAHAAEGGRDRDRFRGRQLAGATVGLVGYGRLGQLVEQRLLAFDARVITHDPAYDLLPLDELLATADAIVVLASLDDTNHGMLGAAELARCHPGAVLVNTARGELVDEAALVAALEQGHLAGAAVDVLADEHDLTAERPLLALARRRPDLVLVTPHIGGATAESMAATEEHLAVLLAGSLAASARE